MSATEVLKDSLSPQTAHGVLPNGMEWIPFPRSTKADGRQSVYIARRKRRNAAIPILLANEPWQKSIHCPGERLLAGGSEFHTCHVNHVGHIRQAGRGGAIQKITCMRLDAPGPESCFQLRFGEPRDTDDTPRDICKVRGPLRHASEGRSHFASDPQEHKVALDGAHCPNRGLRRLTQNIFELLDIPDGLVVAHHLNSLFLLPALLRNPVFICEAKSLVIPFRRSASTLLCQASVLRFGSTDIA